MELIKEDTPPIGFIVMSGENTTFYTVTGTEITQHSNIEVSLPSKHGRGGQSKLRFERLAEEARHNYITKVIESLIRIYPRDLPLVVGGPSYLKERMVNRLINYNVIRVLDIQYDKKRGLYAMLNLCPDLITSLQIANERKWVSLFMNSILLNNNLSVYGRDSIDYCLIHGIIHTLIVHEECITDDIVNLCTKYHTELVIISSFLPESEQIKEGFGGIVGILRYPFDLSQVIDDNSDNSEEYIY